jgi:hypothetical protein
MTRSSAGLAALRKNKKTSDRFSMLDWDADWKKFYFYEQPIPMDANTELEISCTWDTTGLTTPTLPGWGADQEMCLATMMFALPPGVSR